MIEGIKHLGESSRGVILHHLLALDAEDRYARFGSLIRDEGIRALVARLDFERDLLLGILVYYTTYSAIGLTVPYLLL